MWIKRQLELLRTKQYLIQENQELKKLIDFKLEKVLPLIEPLDPSKVYVVVIQDKHESMLFSVIFNRLMLKLKWTSAPLILLDKPVEQLSEIKLKALLLRVKDKKKKKA